MSHLKMSESPMKGISSSGTDKENVVSGSPTAAKELLATEQPVLKSVVPVETPTVASDCKAVEAEEPLLQENPHRFVLFPIKYHEVQSWSFFLSTSYIVDSSRCGKCTRRRRPLSGLQKRSTYQRIFMTGVSA
jgi:hypothetical protein